jgi:hypothetical protein
VLCYHDGRIRCYCNVGSNCSIGSNDSIVSDGREIAVVVMTNNINMIIIANSCSNGTFVL